MAYRDLIFVVQQRAILEYYSNPLQQCIGQREMSNGVRGLSRYGSVIQGWNDEHDLTAKMNRMTCVTGATVGRETLPRVTMYSLMFGKLKTKVAS